MSLNFPNPSRSYEPDHARVRFWGHDDAMEVSFFLNEDALFHLSPIRVPTKRRSFGRSTPIVPA